MIEENKFRALKKGLDGNIIDFPHRRAAPTRALILEMLDFVDDVVDDLGTRAEIDFVRAWAASGDTGADRQIAVYEATARPARGGGHAGGRDPARLVDSRRTDVQPPPLHLRAEARARQGVLPHGLPGARPRGSSSTPASSAPEDLPARRPARGRRRRPGHEPRLAEPRPRLAGARGDGRRPATCAARCSRTRAAHARAVLRRARGGA